MKKKKVKEVAVKNVINYGDYLLCVTEEGIVRLSFDAFRRNIIPDGRNLLIGSKNFTFTKDQYNCTSAVKDMESPFGKIDKVLELGFSGNSNNYFRLHGVNEPNKEFTFLCWLWRPSGVSYSIIASDKVLKTINVNGWVLIEATFTSSSDISTYDFFEIHSNYTQGPNGLWLFEPKIQRGSFASSWSPAWEDLQFKQ